MGFSRAAYCNPQGVRYNLALLDHRAGGAQPSVARGEVIYWRRANKSEVQMKFVLLAFALLAGSEVLAIEGNSKPLAVHSGADSKVTRPQYKLITADKQWQDIWASHLGTSADDAYRQAFEVDFDKCMVVAILRGNRTNVRGVKIYETIYNGDAIVLRFDDVGYQTAGPDGGAETKTPFAFVVLPNVAKDVVLEEDVQQYLGERHEWKELTRLKKPR